LLVTTNIEEWEGYHSIAGEIMFLPWLGVYLITIMYIEQRLRMYASKSAGNPDYPM
jgi:thaumarchaeosortase